MWSRLWFSLREFLLWKRFTWLQGGHPEICRSRTSSNVLFAEHEQLKSQNHPSSFTEKIIFQKLHFFWLFFSTGGVFWGCTTTSHSFRNVTSPVLNRNLRGFVTPRNATPPQPRLTLPALGSGPGIRKLRDHGVGFCSHPIHCWRSSWVGSPQPSGSTWYDYPNGWPL